MEIAKARKQGCPSATERLVWITNSYEAWCFCQHSPLPTGGAPQARGGIRHWRRPPLQQGSAGGGQRPTGKHQPSPQGTVETSIQRMTSAKPISQMDIAQNPQRRQATPNNLHRGSSWSAPPALRSGWKIASGPGKNSFTTARRALTAFSGEPGPHPKQQSLAHWVRLLLR